jgi:hypothetical protein
MSRNSVWALSLTVAFGAGLLCGRLTQDNEAAAAPQRFGPADVKSVPPAFLEGGDRQYSALKELVSIMSSSEQRLAAIEANTAGMGPALAEQAQQTKQMAGYLRQISGGGNE